MPLSRSTAAIAGIGTLRLQLFFHPLNDDWRNQAVHLATFQAAHFAALAHQRARAERHRVGGEEKHRLHAAGDHVDVGLAQLTAKVVAVSDALDDHVGLFLPDEIHRQAGV